ncbi:MAG: hypothetical protein ACKOCN_05225, partial [Planctomycetaceae bacterium]
PGRPVTGAAIAAGTEQDRQHCPTNPRRDGGLVDDRRRRRRRRRSGRFGGRGINACEQENGKDEKAYSRHWRIIVPRMLRVADGV